MLKLNFFRMTKGQLLMAFVMLVEFQAANATGIDAKEKVDTKDKIFDSRSVECKAFIKTLPAGFSYDWVRVPENSRDLHSPKISVFYWWASGKNGLAPLTFFNGGPNGDSHGSEESLSPQIQEFTRVYIDQRGTGCSDALPEPRSEKEIKRYLHYLSRGIVFDAEAIRKKLFKNKPWVLFGQSFGSLVVQRYVSLFPHSIVSAHASGLAAEARAEQYPYFRLVAHYRNLTRHFNQFPEDQERINRIRALIPKTLCTKTELITACGPDMLDIFGYYLGWSYFGQKFHDSLELWSKMSDSAVVEAVVADVSSRVAKLHDSPERGEILNILYNRSEAYASDQSPVPSLTEIYQNSFKRLIKDGYKPVDTWTLGEEARMFFSFQGNLHKIADTMKILKADQLRPADVAAGLKKNPKLNLFLYVGELDSVSPPESFQEMRDLAIPNIHFKQFENRGHEAYKKETAIWDDIRAK